ncbi:MAG: hypothetical protein HYZ68_01290, partial [Chloroflexi bacterium]|nr:hypothetical protein [Chloroflexota bacterium]
SFLHNSPFFASAPTSGSWRESRGLSRTRPHSSALGGLQPLILGHKGAPQVAPENTLASLRVALELGADGVEFDVRPCRSGELVVIHDESVDRTTNGRGRVSSLSLSQLKALDAGSWFHPRFEGERIPTLEVALEVASSASLIDIELKVDVRRRRAHIGRRALGIVAERGLLDRVLFSSFDPFVLWHLRHLDPRVRTGLLLAPRRQAAWMRAWRMGETSFDVLCPHHQMLNPEFVGRARANGYGLLVWTISEPAEMRRLAQLGIDGLITDRPDLALRVLREEAS